MHLLILRSLNRSGEEEMATTAPTTKTPLERHGGGRAFVQGVHGVRYQVTDVARAVAFYTTPSASRSSISNFLRSPASHSAMRNCC